MASYDVFLSHRGPDTRLEFCSFLYEALVRAGLTPFVDNKNIRNGKEGWPQILEALQGAKLVLVIFSEGFASSRWCLEELEVMLQQPGKVMPVFYGVATGLEPPQDTLELLEGKYGSERVVRWQEALQRVSKIAGRRRHETGG